MAKSKKTRRGNNEGSVYKRADGRWTASVTVGTDENGKRIRKVFYGKTKTEVAMKMSTAVSERLVGGSASIVNDPLQVLMQQWLVVFKQAEVSARTFERNLGIAKLHVYPVIGQLKITEVTTNIIQGMLNKMLFNGYAIASVRKVKFLLNQFFAHCKRSKFISENPVADCVLKSTGAREHKEIKKENYKAIPKEVREKFMEVIHKHETLEALCMTMIYSGMRIGEALALRWKDVNFKERLLNVDNAITTIPVFDKDYNIVDRKTVVSDTKTAASVREVPIPDVLYGVLRAYQQKRGQLQQLTGYSLTDNDDFVFGTNEGQLRTYYGTRAMFRRLMKENGLDKYGFHFHTLRHTYSTMLFEMQENPKIIQMLLGHKDVSTTIRIYNSVDRSFFKQATDKLEKQFKKD